MLGGRPLALTRDGEFWAAFKAHSGLTVRAAGVLTEMLEHPERSLQLVQDISDIEHQGDKVTHDTVLALHQTWITPLDREEIHGLVSRLDDVLDFIDAAADRVALYQITTARPEALDLAKILQASCSEIERAMGMLHDMKNAKDLLQLCRQINRHEHDADQIFRRALARLFNERTEALELMKWRDIMESIETATDRAEDVANIIEGIVLEHG
jgi:predicted phosphate transport protein (TIGR00153 family)